MVHRHHRRDITQQQFIDDLVVMSYAGLVHVIRESVGQNSRPRDREPINVHAELLDHFDVTLPLLSIASAEKKSRLFVNYSHKAGEYSATA